MKIRPSQTVYRVQFTKFYIYANKIGQNFYLTLRYFRYTSTANKQMTYLVFHVGLVTQSKNK